MELIDRMNLRSGQAEAVRASAGLGRWVECVWGSKFYFGWFGFPVWMWAMRPEWFASEAALHAVVLGTLQGAILIAVVICNFE